MSFPTVNSRNEYYKVIQDALSIGLTEDEIRSITTSIPVDEIFKQIKLAGQTQSNQVPSRSLSESIVIDEERFQLIKDCIDAMGSITKEEIKSNLIELNLIQPGWEFDAIWLNYCHGKANSQKTNDQPASSNSNFLRSSSSSSTLVAHQPIPIERTNTLTPVINSSQPLATRNTQPAQTFCPLKKAEILQEFVKASKTGVPLSHACQELIKKGFPKECVNHVYQNLKPSDFYPSSTNTGTTEVSQARPASTAIRTDVPQASPTPTASLPVREPNLLNPITVAANPPLAARNIQPFQYPPVSSLPSAYPQYRPTPPSPSIPASSNSALSSKNVKSVKDKSNKPLPTQSIKPPASIPEITLTPSELGPVYFDISHLSRTLGDRMAAIIEKDLKARFGQDNFITNNSNEIPPNKPVVFVMSIPQGIRGSQDIINRFKKIPKNTQIAGFLCLATSSTAGSHSWTKSVHADDTQLTFWYIDSKALYQEMPHPIIFDPTIKLYDQNKRCVIRPTGLAEKCRITSTRPDLSGSVIPSYR